MPVYRVMWPLSADPPRGPAGILLLAAYNEANTPDLSPNVGWTPTLFVEVHPTQAVPGLVMGNAGPFKD